MALALLATLLQLTIPGTASAIAQRAGTFELEMDAPWRMEPRGAGREYGAIPIQLSIHDADQPNSTADVLLQKVAALTVGNDPIGVVLAVLTDSLGSFVGSLLSLAHLDVPSLPRFPATEILDRFKSLQVFEEIDGQFVPQRTFTLANAHEVERTIGLWQYDPTQLSSEAPGSAKPRPQHDLCRVWQGEDCSRFAALRPTSEWHLTAMYTPSDSTPGRDVRLRTVLKARVRVDGVLTTKTYERFLSVHLGEAPLPKFGSDWAYGDLHYHSQGTDNDGESGYSWRGTLQAMSAMGLDFAFATEHASNSEQIGSAELEFSSELVHPLGRGLRDMSPDRFAFGIDLLNGRDGGNREVTSYPRASADGQGLFAPQLFLGGEVDVVPEGPTIVNGFETHGPVQFCSNASTALRVLDQRTPFPNPYDYGWCLPMKDPQPDGRSLLYDVQGPADGELLSHHFYARQHMLHLPEDGRDEGAFIASNTSKYGGATRRLKDILDVEYRQRQKGYAFLAHPFAVDYGKGIAGVGPDLIPYSDVQLDDAFASPYVLGLQIWNEDAHYSAAPYTLKLEGGNPDSPYALDGIEFPPFQAPQWEKNTLPLRKSDFERWDRMQLQGLDKARTDLLSWLPYDSPRRVFIAGGSDAHGDWNYRRKGYFFGTDELTDVAIGKPRNLVFVGEPDGDTITTGDGSAVPVSQHQVIEGLRSGNFVVTDGPAVRIVVDVNHNGTIDSQDVPMGSVYREVGDDPFQLIVEWKSTPEFGKVNGVSLLLGVWADGVDEGIVYQNTFDGLVVDERNAYTNTQTGETIVRAPGVLYWYDPNPANPLVIVATDAEAYHGTRVVTIDPSRYPVGRGICRMDSLGGGSLFQVQAVNTEGSIEATSSDGATAVDDAVVYLDNSLQSQLDDLANGNVVGFPQCDHREFVDARPPERLFIRAEVGNDAEPNHSFLCVDDPLSELPRCAHRRGYSNPVWINVNGCASTTSCDLGSSTGGQLVGGQDGENGTGGGGSTGGTLTTSVSVDDLLTATTVTSASTDTTTTTTTTTRPTLTAISTTTTTSGTSTLTSPTRTTSTSLLNLR